MFSSVYTYIGILLASTVGLACASSHSERQASPAQPLQPNILWLVIEDQSPNFSAFGDSTVSTPTIDRLAREGVRYTHVFSPSGVCAPSRAALATGMYPTRIGANHMRTGPWTMQGVSREALQFTARYLPTGITPYEVVPPPEVRLHSEYLRRAGYFATNNAKEDYQFRAPVTTWDENGPKAHWRHRKPGQPFFAVFNFEVTHESQIWGRANSPLRVDEQLKVPVPPYLPDTEIARRDIRRMYSNIVEMDEQVGRVLDELEADGLLDSTIVFWYADNGGPLPRQKRLLYDSGMRVPLIIRFPNRWKAGAIDDQLVSFVDFLPTLLSLARIRPPEYLDGQAFLGPYRASKPRTYVHGAADRFDERYDMIRAVRDARFKYLRNYHPESGYYLPIAFREQMPIMQELLRLRDEGRLDAYQAQWFRSTKPEEELFDTVNDPHELHNLAGDARYADRLAELRAENDRWMQATHDKGLIPETALIESFWPGSIQPVTCPPDVHVENRKVLLSCKTEGASIAYQRLKTSTEPGPAWQVYTGPLVLKEGERIVAIAHRIGFKPSDPVSVE